MHKGSTAAVRDTRDTDAMSDASENGSRKRDWDAEMK